MHWIDFVVVGVFLIGLLGMGFALSKRAGKNTEEFILAGRKLPWWLAGTSIVATGLNASTMLQDSRKIRQDGIAGMWFTWGGVIGGMIGAVWFTRLWRRAGFTTQMEFYQARYAGWPAVGARLYDAVVYGIFIAAIWASVGLVGMKKIADVLLGLPPEFVVFGFGIPSDTAVVLMLVVVTLIYSAASGVYGVVWTDMVEFVIAMFCSYLLLAVVYHEVGWNVGLRDQVRSLGAEGDRILTLFPVFGPVLLYFFLIGPILNQGGYNPHIQRYLALKDEREVLFTAIYNAVVNFVVKSWPYYLCGLAGMFIISDAFLLENFAPIMTPAGEAIPDYEKVFPALVERYLPVGLVGLMVAGFLSAFMSSFDTNIHNSTSIFINDIYRPYVAPKRDEKHYVRLSRLYMVAITVFASIIGIVVQDILMLTMFAMAVMASSGIIKLLRFIWWRVNGMSEIVGQATSFALTVLMISPWGNPFVVSVALFFGQEGNDGFFVTRQLILIGISSITAVATIFLFPPEPMDRLVEFYKRLRPFGWWGPVRRACGEDLPKPDSMIVMAVLSVSAISFIFGLLFVALGLFLALWTVLFVALAVAILGALGSIWGTRTLYPPEDRNFNDGHPGGPSAAV